MPGELSFTFTTLLGFLLVQARVVRVQGCGDGWYEVGAVLLPPDELPPEEEILEDGRPGG